MQRTTRFFQALLLFTTLTGICGTAHAQCYGNAQAESWTCSSAPLSLSANTQCGNCTYSWSPAPVSGQGTPIASYQYTPGSGYGTGMANVTMNGHNPNVPCSYSDMWQIGIGAEPTLALPALTNGPWDGDTSKVWRYTRSYMNPTGGMGGNYDFTPSWNVTGGVIVRSRHVTAPVMWNDTVEVKWNGAAAMQLREPRLTYHRRPTMISGFNCNWNPVPTTMALPPLAVFYNGSACIGTAKNFFTFPYAGSTYTWSVTNGSVVGGQGTNSAQIILNGPATVTVQRDSSGTITSANVGVTPVSGAVSIGPDQTVCQGVSATLDAGPGFTAYAWSTGATTQSITVSSPGTYSVTTSINGGCTASDTALITHLPHTAVNLGPDLNLCAFPATLDAGPGYTTYQWSTGATTQTIPAPGAGSYSVTVTSANGCQSNDAVMVYNRQTSVTLPPTMTYCTPGTVVVTPTYANATTYAWSTGATSASITYSGAGTQGVSVTASNVYGCSASASTTITAMPRPTPSLGPDQTVCPGTWAIFDAGPGYASYLWSNSSTAQSITVSTPGTYRVTVTATNGCTGSDTAQFIHHPAAAPSLGPNINVCQPSATLNPGSGYTSYLWSTGATTPTISVTTSGNYAVTVTTANGCTGADAVAVTFNNFNANLGPDMNVCEPQVVTLDPQLTGTFTYNWSTGATTPTLTLTAPGTYNVTLAATNTFGCSDNDTVQVVILPTPATQLGADTIICADTTITLDMGSAFSSYLWSTGATTQAITVTGGVYRVTATAANGCQRLDTMHISGLIDCVFPGDVNYDQVADMMDVLALGPAIGYTGSTRPNASTSWYGQRCNNWLWYVTSGVNAKQADTDGDGLVTADDTTAIQLNFGSTHAKVGAVTGGGNQLYIAPIGGAVAAGDTAYFAVQYLGFPSGPVDSLHGLAMHLTWPTAPLTGSGLVYVDYSAAWFAPAGNRLAMSRPAAGSLDLAITRTSGIDTGGQGLLAILAFATDPSLPASSVTSFMPTATWVTEVNSQLTPKPGQSQSMPINIVGSTAIQTNVLTHVRIWPNPATDRIQVLVEGRPVQRICLVNMLGQVVRDLPGGDEGTYEVDVADLPQGTYCLQARFDTGSMSKQVVVQH